jgi:hypothetical protein
MDKPISFVHYSDPICRDTALALKLMTFNDERVLIVTNTDERTKFLYGLCR